MGNPMNGDIYEGQLRPGDIGLTKNEVARLRESTLKDRIAEFHKRFQELGALAASESGVTREMPRYKCHKEVWALKIAEIRADKWEREHGDALQVFTVVPQDEGYAPFLVDAAFMAKHKPEVGGYFVVYKDGYKSYSPAQAFEEGYSRL